MISAEQLLEQIQESISMAVQVDRENGVAWLNQQACEEFVRANPELSKVLHAIADLDLEETPGGLNVR